jgi:hypothetical protein
MATKRQFKFLMAGAKSKHGLGKKVVWKKGEWHKLLIHSDQHPYAPYLELCHHGFHCSSNVLDAARVIKDGTILAIVETGGQSVSEYSNWKSAWEKMRVVRMFRFTAADINKLYSFVIKRLPLPPSIDTSFPKSFSYPYLTRIRERQLNRLVGWSNQFNFINPAVNRWVIRNLKEIK